MKIRIKLISVLLIILIIPVLILSIYSSSRYTNMIIGTQIASLKTNNSDKAAFIDEFFRNLASDLKNFASDDRVRQYITDEGADTDISEYVNIEIQNSVKGVSSVEDMFILGNNGKILAAYDRDRVGSFAENIEDLESYADKNNGISRIYPPSFGAGNYFYIVRRIYSRSNEKIGLVCQKVSLVNVAEMLKISGYSNYAGMLLIDSEAKFITTSASTPKRLDTVAEYKQIGNLVKDAIPYYSKEIKTDTVSAEYEGYTFQGTPINTGSWSIVSYYNRKAANSSIAAAFSSVTGVTIVLIILMAAGIVFVCINFTHPISTIIHVIKKLNRGDTDIRLDFDSNDEFGEISYAFNSMFDSILESEQRYRTVVSMMDNVVFEINMKTYKVYLSDNFNQKFSFRAKDDSFNESFLVKMKIHKDDSVKFRDDMNTILNTPADRWEGEYRLKNIYGDFSWIRIHGRKFSDRNGAPEKVIGMMIDIDREKKGAINLMQKANYDALTQLFNRASFLKALDDEMQLSIGRRSLDALMFIDLDDFKHFNDEYGHKCGDEVLKFVADTIKEVTFDKGFGGRLGGDEFVMCLTNLKLIDDAGNVAAEVINTLNGGFISESTGMKFNIHCSIGIAFFREHGRNSTELLESADTAMYKIKKSGKSNYTYAGRT